MLLATPGKRIRSKTKYSNKAAMSRPTFHLKLRNLDLLTLNWSFGSALVSWFRAGYGLRISEQSRRYQQNGASSYSAYTIFRFSVNGQSKFLKYKRYMIIMERDSNTFSARNHPHFINYIVYDICNVMYNTDAAVEHYFYCPNLSVS